MRLLYTYFVLFISLLIGCFSAAQAQEHPTVILLLVDRLSMDDLQTPEAEPLHRLIAYGGLGLANVRAGSAGSAAAYLTLGAGGRAIAGEHAGLAFDVAETYRGRPAGLLYGALTGRAAADGIVHLGVYELQTLAATNQHDTTPGMLGSALRALDVPVSVYGNSDTGHEFSRYGVLVAMDIHGTVESGDVGASSLTEDPMWPLGARTDYELLLRQTQQHMGTGGLVVVELGDLARLEALESLVAPEQMEALRTQTIGRVAQFVHALAQAASVSSRPTVLLLVAPSPSIAALRQGYLMSPLLMLGFGSDGPDGSPAGVLTSHTTRRRGIVANVDVGATILNLFGAPPQGSGRPIGLLSSERPLDDVTSLYERITLIHSQRLPIIQPYFFIQLVTVVLSTALAAGASLLGWRIDRLRPWLFVLHLFLISFPLALLLVPLLPSQRTIVAAWSVVGAVMLALAIGALMVRRWGDVASFTLLCTLTVVIIVLDLLTGTRLLQSSHLGYDPIGGSRYYGIGNEYMGVLLGTATVAAGGFLDVFSPSGRRGLLWAIGLVYALIVFLMASPAHGANVGGTISAVVGLGVVLILFVRNRLQVRHLVFLSILVGLVVAAAAWYDVARFGPETSHLGNAVQQVGTSGTDPLWDIFERKLEMNARLIRLTVWSRAFFVSLLAALLFAFIRPRTVEGLLHAHPYMGRAIRGSLAGAVVVLLVNDSGIVGAATLMIPVISTLLYLVLTMADKPGHRA